MTLLQAVLLVAGAIAALVGNDMLGHRGVGRWPLGLVVIALIVASGAFISAELLAFTLGAAVVTGGASLREWAGELSATRREYRQRKEAEEQRRRRQTEQS